MLNPDQFTQHVNANGGASYRISDNAVPSSGFMVSRSGHEQIVSSPLHPDHVKSFLNEHVKGSTGDPYLGAWVHNQKTYLDLSDQYTHKSSAILAGKKNNQLAIYDVGNDKEIKVRSDQS